MVYQHDVFISYSHGFIEDWLNDYFIPQFKWRLEGAAGYEPTLFIDRDGISAGDSWPLRLKNALATSKCVVALWSPSYFNSKWCLKECYTMLHREDQYGFRSVENPGGLVIPINISDGQSFHTFGDKDIQYLDLRDYVIDGEAFKQTTTYVEFQKKIEKWSKDVAKAMESAPEWEEVWLQLDISSPDTDEAIFDQVPE